jgi:hypothetical protein
MPNKVSPVFSVGAVLFIFQAAAYTFLSTATAKGGSRNFKRGFNLTAKNF